MSNDLNVRYPVIFCRSWMSILPHLILALLVSLVVFIIAAKFNLRGPTFTIPNGSKDLTITLPVFLIFTLIIIARPLVLLKDCRYEMGMHHLRSVTGLLSLNRVNAEIAYEDLHGVRVSQTPLERILNVGSIVAWTALADNPDITMKGIYNPDQKASQITRKLDEIRILKNKKSS